MKQLLESFVKDFLDMYGKIYGESIDSGKQLLKEYEVVDVYVVHPDGHREFVYSKDDEGNRSKRRAPGKYYVGDVEIPYEKYYGSKKKPTPEKKTVEIDFSEPKNSWKAVGNLYKCLKVGVGKGDLPEGTTKTEVVGAMSKNVAYLSQGKTFDILKAVQEVLPDKPGAFYDMELVWDGDTVGHPGAFGIVEKLAKILGNDSIPVWISLFTTDPKEIGKALDAAQASGREKYKEFGEDHDKNIWAGWIPSESAEETLKNTTSDGIIDYFFGKGIGFGSSSQRMSNPECPYAIYVDAVRFFMEKDPAKKNGILDEIRKKLTVNGSDSVKGDLAEGENVDWGKRLEFEDSPWEMNGVVDPNGGELQVFAYKGFDGDVVPKILASSDRFDVDLALKAVEALGIDNNQRPTAFLNSLNEKGFSGLGIVRKNDKKVAFGDRFDDLFYYARTEKMPQF